MNSQGARQKFKYIIGVAVLSLFTSFSTVSEENIPILQKQIRARVVSISGTPLPNAHIRVQLLRALMCGNL